jgi:hypothetical protein
LFSDIDYHSSKKLKVYYLPAFPVEPISIRPAPNITWIKSKSDKNSCTLVYGTDHDDGYYEGYAYQATTIGSRCDTTAIQKSINDAVRTCATKLHKARAVTGYCKFSHGGSWHGHLRLSANPDRYPVRSAQC